MRIIDPLRRLRAFNIASQGDCPSDALPFGNCVLGSVLNAVTLRGSSVKF
jgi:hypothetical protein